MEGQKSEVPNPGASAAPHHPQRCAGKDEEGRVPACDALAVARSHFATPRVKLSFLSPLPLSPSPSLYPSLPPSPLSLLSLLPTLASLM